MQGFTVAISFWAVGIPGAAFWGAIVAFLSLIPSIGSGLVWIPVVVFLLLDGQIGYGVGLALWNIIVTGNIDNVLRPAMVGKDSQMPDLLILISTLGGIGFFGIIGFILGPIIAGLLLTVIEMYHLEGLER